MEAVINIQDLLTEILVRVPPRPLIRFKCVSKHWLSLISDPEFCHLHTLQNPRPSVTVFPRLTTASFLSLDDLDHGRPRSDQTSANCNPLSLVPNLHDDIMILQSSNGLFLCSPGIPIFDEQPTYYYVLNPTTKKFSTLTPPSVAATSSGQILTEALAFDPSRSPHYKLLVFWTVDEYSSDFHVDIYSSETKSWRLVDSSISPEVFIRHYAGGLHFNGAVHWVHTDKQLLYYHIDDERLGHVDPRHPYYANSSFLQESNCGSRLHLVDIYVLHIEVSEMKSDYSGWCLKYHIDLSRIHINVNLIFPSFRPRKTEFSVLFLTPEETEGDESSSLSSLLIHIPGQVISYKLKTDISKSFRLTPRQGIDDSKLRVTQPNYRYMESLACV